jgi:hypothetical protein
MSQTVSSQLPEPASPARKRRGTSLSLLSRSTGLISTSATGAAAKFQFSNPTTPLHLFKTWFINGLTRAQVGLRWTATDPNCISRVNKVMANALMVLKEQPALGSVLHPAGVRPVPPPTASAEMRRGRTMCTVLAMS